MKILVFSLQIKRRLMAFIMFASALLVTLPANTVVAYEAAWLYDASRGFEGVAKKAIPAAVSIRISQEIERGPYDEGRQDPYDSFDGDFWQHFFGTSPQGRREREGAPIVGLGSGFLVSADGYILTNNHVVHDATKIEVILTDGREFEAALVGMDSNTDLAVIKIESNDLPYLTLGDSNELQPGQWVVAVGNSLGTLQASLTVGVVSATGRDDLHLSKIENFIQTDAAINKGNSGGPLLNLNGEVIGINTAIATNTGGYMGIGFAIPSNIVSHVMDQIVATGTVTRGFLGVTLQPIDQELAEAFNLDRAEGALVADIMEGSPAKEAGLQQGDVILRYNGTAVTKLQSLSNAIALMSPGSTITLTVKRDGRVFDTTVTIGPHPDSVVSAGELSTELGFDIQQLSPGIAEHLGYTNDSGVVIAKVDRRSAAAMAGLRSGQLILAINQQKVSSPESFYEQVKKSLAGNKRVLLLVKQGRQTRFVSLKIG